MHAQYAAGAVVGGKLNGGRDLRERSNGAHESIGRGPAPGCPLGCPAPSDRCGGVEAGGGGGGGGGGGPLPTGELPPSGLLRVGLLLVLDCLHVLGCHWMRQVITLISRRRSSRWALGLRAWGLPCSWASLRRTGLRGWTC